MASYEATVRWRRGADETFTDNRYSRAHECAFDGGALVRASSSPQVVRVPLSDPTGIDPEEAFVAALSSCHEWHYSELHERWQRHDQPRFLRRGHLHGHRASDRDRAP
jgi:organic hydroperoxide reductase OsmC/OhrA